MKSVGIIGNGFVGNAIYENFKDRAPTKVFDVYPEKCLNTYAEVISSDIIFVCLPTPMLSDGRCDVSYVEQFFNSVPQETYGLFVLKSTVPIGTTESISKKRADLRIVHNPEFLTAVNAKDDFLNTDRNVIGGEWEDCNELYKFFEELFPEWKNVSTYFTTTNESETIKYYSNSFLALKIAYFNNVYELCKKFDSNYEIVRRAITQDHRIGEYHTQVPGPDGKLGFGGYCFPKDINALIHTLNENDLNSELLTSAWEYNKKIREE